ncbi:MAG: ornithine carbamoyltransferase, partial [Thermoplasmata archaeon]
LWGGRFGGRTLAYIGDGNNVCNSLLLGCAIVGLDFVGAIPARYRPPAEILALAQELAKVGGGAISLVEAPAQAARGADVLYTDVWVSMGDEAQASERTHDFSGYVLDEALLAQAKPGCRVMHDLPAHRGLEITDAVLDGPSSIVFDQAENRLHAQKAILELFLKPRGP